MSAKYMCKTHEEANFLNTETEKLLKGKSGFFLIFGLPQVRESSSPTTESERYTNLRIPGYLVW